MVKDASLLFSDGGELAMYFAPSIVNLLSPCHQVTLALGFPSREHSKITDSVSFMVIFCGEVKILGGSEQVKVN